MGSWVREKILLAWEMGEPGRPPPQDLHCLPCSPGKRGWHFEISEATPRAESLWLGVTPLFTCEHA